MIKDEASFWTIAKTWLKYNTDKFPKSFLIEAKVIRRLSISFPYSELSEKEERLLLRAKNSRVISTHSDIGRVGTDCDASVISGGGFIFLKNIRPRNKTFYVIDIEKFIEHRENSTKKSITEDEVKSIAYLTANHV